MSKSANSVLTNPNLKYSVNTLSHILFNMQKVDSKMLAWPTSTTSGGNKQSNHCKCDPWPFPPEIPFTMPVFNVPRTQPKFGKPCEMNEINKTRFFAALNDWERIAHTIRDICNMSSDSFSSCENYKNAYPRKIKAPKSKVLSTIKSKEYSDRFANELFQANCTKTTNELHEYNNPYKNALLKTPHHQWKNNIIKYHDFTSKSHKTSLSFPEHSKMESPADLPDNNRSTTSPTIQEIYKVPLPTVLPKPKPQSHSMSKPDISKAILNMLKLYSAKPQRKQISNPVDFSKTKTQSGSDINVVNQKLKKSQENNLLNIGGLSKAKTQSNIGNQKLNKPQKINVPNLAEASKMKKKKQFLVDVKKMGSKIQGKDTKRKLSKTSKNTKFAKKYSDKMSSEVQEKPTNVDSPQEIISPNGDKKFSWSLRSNPKTVNNYKKIGYSKDKQEGYKEQSIENKREKRKIGDKKVQDIHDISILSPASETQLNIIPKNYWRDVIRGERKNSKNSKTQTNISYLMEQFLEYLIDESNKILQEEETAKNNIQATDFKEMADIGRLSKYAEDPTTEVKEYQNDLSNFQQSYKNESKKKSKRNKPRKSNGIRKLQLNDTETSVKSIKVNNSQMDIKTVNSWTDSQNLSSMKSEEQIHRKASIIRMQELWTKAISNLKETISKGLRIDKILEVTNETNFKNRFPGVDPSMRIKLSLILQELMKSHDSMVSLDYAKRLEKVKEYLFENTLTLSDMENISVADINMDDLLLHPYKTIFPDVEDTTKAVPTKPKIRKKAPKKNVSIEEIKPIKKPCCNICSVINRNSIKEEKPWMTKMKLDWNRIELKAYIKYRQIFQSEFYKPKPDISVVAPCVNPRTICDQMYEFCKNFA